MTKKERKMTMLWFVLGILLMCAGIGATVYFFFKRKKLAIAIIPTVVGVILGGLCFVPAFLLEVQPAHMGKVYTLSGQQRNLVQGYNRVSPWDKNYVVSVATEYFEFYQEDFVSGNVTGANDVFGAQSKDADYIYALAKLGVRIDPERFDEYISRYGANPISKTALKNIFKDILKAAMDEAFKDYGTEELMSKKAEVANIAANIAKDKLTAYPVIVEQVEYADFDAGEAYESNIKAKAALRQQTEQAELQKKLNEEKAAADKAKADGEAAVKLVEAQSQAAVKQVEAENASEVARIKAESNANVKKLEAEADAKVIEITATAEANAALAKSEAEAKGAELLGQVYDKYTALIEFERLNVQKEIASRWNGLLLPSIGTGDNGISFMNLTDIVQQMFGIGLDSVTTTPTN